MFSRHPGHRQQQGRDRSQSLDIRLDQRLLGDKYQGEEVAQVLQAADHHHIQVRRVKSADPAPSTPQ